MKKQPLRIAEDDSDRKLLADVARVGWHFVAIEPDEVGPGYVFSVGLFHTFDHPEIILLGLDYQIAAQLINAIGAEVQRGSSFSDGSFSEAIADGYPMAFRSVARDFYRSYVGYALWFYESLDFPLLQCFWPDKSRLFPWQAACDSECRRMQQLQVEAK